MKVRASLKNARQNVKLLDVTVVCMLLTRKILSLNNVKDNFLFLQDKYFILWL